MAAKQGTRPTPPEAGGQADQHGYPDPGQTRVARRPGPGPPGAAPGKCTQAAGGSPRAEPPETQKQAHGLRDKAKKRVNFGLATRTRNPAEALTSGALQGPAGLLSPSRTRRGPRGCQWAWPVRPAGPGKGGGAAQHDPRPGPGAPYDLRRALSLTRAARSGTAQGDSED